MRSERRFSEIVKFHDAFVTPLQSLDCKVLLPSDLDPVAYLEKNEPDVVAERRIAIQHWANSCLEMASRTGSASFDASLPLFLRGGNALEACPKPVAGDPWDPSGEWVFNTRVQFSGETYAVPRA